LKEYCKDGKKSKEITKDMNVISHYLTHYSNPNPSWENLLEDGLFLAEVLHKSSTDVLVVDELCKSFIFWQKQINDLFTKKKVDRILVSKLQEANADSGNIARGGSVYGRPLYEDQLLESLRAEVSRHISLLRDAEKYMNAKVGLTLEATNQKNFSVAYNGETSTKPFSKKSQFSRVLEYVLMQPKNEEGVPFVITWDAVWNDLIAYHKSTPFTRPPITKKESAIKKSIERHLQRVTKELRSRFSQMPKDKSLFENISGGFIINQI
jgi:hypothetical protein